MKRLLITSIVVVAMLLCSTGSATVAEGWEGGIVIELKNTSQYVKIARVYWVDHPYRDKWPKPYDLSVAEIKPDKSFSIGGPPGIYVFIWELCHRPDLDQNKYGRRVIIPSGISRVTITDKFDITPEEVIVTDEFVIERKR